MSLVNKQKLKYTSVGRTLVLVHENVKYTFTGETEERKEIKELIEKWNKRNTKVGLERLLSKFTAKSEKKKMLAKIEKKKTKKRIKEVKKEIKALKEGEDPAIKEALVIVGKNKAFTVKKGKAYLTPYLTVPLPELLVRKIAYSLDVRVNIDHFIKFWELCLLNPNPIARTKLFDYLSRHNLLITPNGYFVTFRMVKKTDEEGVFTSAHNEHKKDRERYMIGKAYSIPREECDEDGANECSKGLHTGSPKFIGIEPGDGYGEKKVTTKVASPSSYGTGYDYVPQDQRRDQNFSTAFGDQAVICLVNPMHVVSIPNSDTRKMRSCELYFAKLTTPEEVIDLTEKDYLLYDDAYLAYERVIMNEMLKKAKLTNWVDTKKHADKKFRTDAKKAELQQLKENILKVNQDPISQDKLSLADINKIVRKRIKK